MDRLGSVLSPVSPLATGVPGAKLSTLRAGAGTPHFHT